MLGVLMGWLDRRESGGHREPHRRESAAAASAWTPAAFHRWRSPLAGCSRLPARPCGPPGGM